MKNGLTVDEFGSKRWYLNDKLHRENDLPAIEHINGDKYWWLNGKLHRENDLPAIEYVNGDKYWYLNDKRHRVDGPAIELADGTRTWRLNDNLHRVDGPAIEDADGDKRWWLNDKKLTEKQIKIFKEILSCDIKDLPLFMGDELFAEVIENRFRKFNSKT